MSRGKGRKTVASRAPSQLRDLAADMQRHRRPHDGKVTQAPGGGYPTTAGTNINAPSKRQASGSEMSAAVTAYEPASYSSSTAWHPAGADY